MAPTTIFGLPVSLPAEVLLYGGIGLGALILLLIILLIIRSGRKKRAPARTGTRAGTEGAGNDADEDEELPQQPARDKRPLPSEIVLNETREQALKRQVKEFTAGNPEIVAQLIRSWMKEENK
jgi:flagellar biosynthesis/type III secretory pathway M-ring protein FliF/YscJ